jgi:heme-degrading monooxygenase HmoA
LSEGLIAAAAPAAKRGQALRHPLDPSPNEVSMPDIDSSGLIGALHAGGPAPDRREALDLYGQFVGDWEAEIVTHAPDGARHEGRGEIHFGWILEGRAIQDVWMIPRSQDRRRDAPPLPVAGNWYGTTIRAYDRDLDAWRIYWIDPATNAYRQQIGRKQGADIVQEGVTEAGIPTRWKLQRDHAAILPLERRGVIGQGRVMASIRRGFRPPRRAANRRSRRSEETRNMIARLWRGYARPEHADAYQAMLTPELLPGIGKAKGYRGSYLLRRTIGGEVEFVTILLWDSIAAIRAIAGDDYEKAVVPGERRKYLTRWEDRSAHYEICATHGLTADDCV